MALCPPHLCVPEDFAYHCIRANWNPGFLGDRKVTGEVARKSCTFHLKLRVLEPFLANCGSKALPFPCDLAVEQMVFA